MLLKEIKAFRLLASSINKAALPEWLAGKQLCREKPGGLGGQQANHELATCPCSKEGHQPPGLC